MGLWSLGTIVAHILQFYEAGRQWRQTLELRGVISTEYAATYVFARRATIQGGRGNIEWLRP